MTLVTLFFLYKEGEKMASNLADILVTLTLDTSEFSERLREAGQELNNFRNHVRQVTTNMESDFTNSMSNMGNSMNSLSQSTQTASQNISQSMNSASQSTNRLGQSSKSMVRNFGTDMESMYRIVQQATTEFERFGTNSNRVSLEVAKNFGNLPKHLQLYVQRLQEAGKSTEAFAQLNELYGKRILENMKRSNQFMQEGSTQASRLVDSMRNADISPFTRQLLGIGDALERSARQGSAFNLAIKKLGENASLRDIQAEMRVINEGIMRAQSNMMLWGIASAGMLYGMVLLSNEVDGRLVPAFEKLKSTWADALTPFINAFTTFVLWVMKGAQALGELAKKLAEVHPQLSQMLWGFMALTVVLLAILSPLAVTGVLAEGLAATFMALWGVISSFVLGFLAVVPTAMAVAGAIVVVVASINNMWKASEKLRNAWNSLWAGVGKAFHSGFVEPVKQAFSGLQQAFSNFIANLTGGAGTMASLWTFLGDHVGTVVNAIASVTLPILSFAFQLLGQIVAGVINGITFMLNALIPAGETVASFGEKLKNMFTQGDFEGLIAMFQNLIPSIVGFLIGGIPQLIIMGTQLIQGLANGMGMSIPELLMIPVNILMQMINAFLTALPTILNVGMQIINALLQGILTALPMILEALATYIPQILTMITTIVTTYLPQMLNAGIQILQTILNGILQTIPQLLPVILNVVMTILNTIAQNLPKILDAGMKVLMALLDGIAKMLPQIITMVLQIITMFCNFVMQNLPQIIDSGMKVLTALIQGIIKVLPQIVTTVMQIISKFVQMIVQNLPQIIQSGIQILTALIKGIVQIMPQLSATALSLILKVASTIIQNLPQIITSGIQLLLALIKGIIQTIPTLVGAIPQVVKAIFNAFKNVQWGDIGRDIMTGIKKGILAFKDVLFGTVADIAKGLLQKGKDILGIHSPSRVFAKEVGRFIPQGIAVGIEQDSDIAMSSVQDVTSSLVPSKAMLDTAMGRMPSFATAGNSGQAVGNSTNNITINATIREDADIQRIIDEMERRRVISERSQGVFSY